MWLWWRIQREQEQKSDKALIEYIQQKNETFDNLLGAGVVHLLLDRVGGQDSVKHIGLALQEEEQTLAIQFNI